MAQARTAQFSTRRGDVDAEYYDWRILVIGKTWIIIMIVIMMVIMATMVGCSGC